MSQREKTAICYRIMTPKDLPEVLCLMSQTFTSHGPLERIMGINADEFKSMAAFESEPVIEQGLSIVGCGVDGNIVTAIVAFDALTEEPQGEYPAKQKYRPIGAMINPMFERCIDGHCDKSGQLLYMFLVAVDPTCQGKGLLRDVTSVTIENAAKRGFNKVFAVSTVPKTESSLQRLGFCRLEHVLYASFEYQGERPFAEIAEQGGVSVMLRTIDVQPQ